MKILHTIQVLELVRFYKKQGIDITRLIEGIKKFDLYERDDGLRIWMPQVPGDSKFYNDLSKKIKWYYKTDKDEYIIAKQFIKKGFILEIGCAEGHFAKNINSKLYTGLELNKESIKKARSKELNVLNEEFSSYANDHLLSTDTVCSFQVLEHLLNPE